MVQNRMILLSIQTAALLWEADNTVLFTNYEQIQQPKDCSSKKYAMVSRHGDHGDRKREYRLKCIFVYSNEIENKMSVTFKILHFLAKKSFRNDLKKGLGQVLALHVTPSAFRS